MNSNRVENFFIAVAEDGDVLVQVLLPGYEDYAVLLKLPPDLAMAIGEHFIDCAKTGAEIKESPSLAGITAFAGTA